MIMNKTVFSDMMLTAVTLLLLAGCSSGGGGGAVQPTTATVIVSAAGTLPDDTTIGGADLVLALPVGVTIKTAPGSLSALVPDEGTVSASGAAAGNAKVHAVYTAPAGATPGAVRILVANTAGFSTGAFVSIKCDFAGGNPPAAADFSTSAVKFVDGNGMALTGLSASAAVIQP